MMHISDRDAQILADLNRYNLRHPGVIPKKVTKLFARDQASIHELAAAKLEYCKLGLDKPAQPSPGGAGG